MPYVEVWVEPEDCDGECNEGRKAKQLQAKLDEVERLLRAGASDAALSAISDADTIPTKSPAEIAQQYEQWRKGKLAGFTRWG